jgi:hypothetical protein
VLAWGLTIGAVLAALGAYIGYRVTGTFLGAAAGFLTIAIVRAWGSSCSSLWQPCEACDRRTDLRLDLGRVAWSGTCGWQGRTDC